MDDCNLSNKKKNWKKKKKKHGFTTQYNNIIIDFVDHELFLNKKHKNSKRIYY